MFGMRLLLLSGIEFWSCYVVMLSMLCLMAPLSSWLFDVMLSICNTFDVLDYIELFVFVFVVDVCVVAITPWIWSRSHYLCCRVFVSNVCVCCSHSLDCFVPVCGSVRLSVSP